MKNPLSDIYEQVILNEAEKHSLQNPGSDEVGNLKMKQDLFGNKPKPVEGPDKAKLQKGPSYKETTGSSPSSSKESNASMPKSAAAKQPTVEKGKEMEDTDVDPTDEDEEDNYKKPKKESFTMSAFETLFKKTLHEEMEEEISPDMDLDVDMENSEEDPEETEEEMEETEGDLISDLRELQDRLASILDKLEDVQSEEETEEEGEDYSEEDFSDEFGEEEEEGGEESFKESMERPKALNNSKGKALMKKKNKVGRLSAKGGKAHHGSVKNEPKPKALGDKKGALQKGSPQVRSSITKGDFIK